MREIDRFHHTWNGQILGLNAASLYDVDVSAPRSALPRSFGDTLGALKAGYAAHGAEPGNVRHGWVREGSRPGRGHGGEARADNRYMCCTPTGA